MRYILAIIVATALVTACLPAIGQDRLTSVVRSGDLVWADRYAPRFDPSGTMLAYVEELHLSGTYSTRHVAILDIGGLHNVRISDDVGGLDPAWSSDGRKLAYIEPGTDSPARGRIMAYDVRSYALTQVTPHGDAFEPVWLAGQDRLAYLRYADEGAGPRTMICAINADGSDYEEIVSWSIVEVAGDVAWSSSGRKACYWIFAKGDAAEGVPTRQLSLRIVDLDTKEQRDLPLPEDARHIGEMHWSPDDAYIAIEVTFDKNLTEIWTVPTSANGTDARRITVSEQSENYYYPAWAGGTDGIICVRYPRVGLDGKSAVPNLVLVNTDSRVQDVLTPDWDRPVDPAAGLEMVTSPDGRMVVVAAGAELRFIELGTVAERNIILAADQIRRVGRALARYAVERNGGVMPSPAPGDDSETFWIELVKDFIDEGSLHSPGDPDTGSATSYTYPEAAQGLDARLISVDRGKTILVERSGIHLGGHHELKMNGEVSWVPDDVKP